ncbi:MAG: DUF5131 family protein [Candidatus Methanospirareceae archaeon]
MRRMFSFVSETWNPVVGCFHNCVYCYSRRLATTRLKHNERYKDGFKPKLVEKEFKRKFKPDTLVFVSDMGDLLGSWVPEEWIKRVLEHIRKFPKTQFLLLTKNPVRYLEFLEENVIPENCILGATIETNRPTDRISNAPSPLVRYIAMKDLRKEWKGTLMVSIEPIMDFDKKQFREMIWEIEPDFVVVGYDNYKCDIPKPKVEKTLEFIDELKRFTKVFVKTIP